MILCVVHVQYVCVNNRLFRPGLHRSRFNGWGKKITGYNEITAIIHFIGSDDDDGFFFSLLTYGFFWPAYIHYAELVTSTVVMLKILEFSNFFHVIQPKKKIFFVSSVRSGYWLPVIRLRFAY